MCRKEQIEVCRVKALALGLYGNKGIRNLGSSYFPEGIGSP